MTDIENVKFLVLETGYIERYIPSEYQNFDFFGMSTVDGRCWPESMTNISLELQRGYLMFKKKPDIEISNDLVDDLIKSITPYCAFFDSDGLSEITSQEILIDNQVQPVLIYHFDTESG
jgi:hypothetical protein